uniref:Uncharacterized protein n=1 Tax=Arundo donax TaxID=35708 RepID=A0A0A9UA24_ARUDO
MPSSLNSEGVYLKKVASHPTKHSSTVSMHVMCLSGSDDSLRVSF